MNERFIAPAFIVSMLCGIGLMVTYAMGGDPQAEGLLLFGAFAGFGTALTLWQKHLLPHNEDVQERHHVESTPEEQKEFLDTIDEGSHDITRRKFLTKLGGGAIGAMGLAALFPLKSLGPNPGDKLFHTDWHEGSRLTREDGSYVRPTDLEEGGIITVWPEGHSHEEQNATLLIRVPVDQFQPKKGREDWIVEGNVAYSKICTHVGCPVALYHEIKHELLCPCHQSTFKVLEHGKPVFGPAARSLPQLPLRLDSAGYLVAQSDYREPIGPGFWNRGRKKGDEA
jgi:ubiquinol-cytochrome c reductase iron-sulfur subunit